jgi:hypothetical protein
MTVNCGTMFARPAAWHPVYCFVAPPPLLSVLHRPRQKVEARSGKKSVTTLREHVRTIDQEARPDGWPPFERTIRQDRGFASDLQAFGYRAAPNDPAIGPHGAWNLFRHGLYLGDHAAPLLVVQGKHALTAIRILNVEPGDQTRILESP